jgi:fermentation-respiration switch protein FrsA (DUF1100 family)
MIVLIVVGIAVLGWGVRQLEPRMAFFPFAGENVTPRQFGADFTALTLDTADGERLRAWHLPHADPLAQIVYFHGNGGNLSVWTDVLVGLWRERFDVIAVDYRGYGLSSGTPTEQGLYRDVEATVAAVDANLRRADVPLIYWGRSLGAAMAGYAATRGRPDGVVLEAGFPSGRSLFDRNPVMLVLSAFSTYRFATAEWMAAVTVPTLVIHGDRDSVIPYRHGERLYERLPGPKRFVTIPGGDHNDPIPADAPLYWGAVREFIASLSVSSPRQ